MAGASYFKIAKNEALKNWFMSNESTNEFDELIAVNNMAIKVTGSINEMEMAVKKKLTEELKLMQSAYEKTKEVYNSMAEDLGAKDAQDFAKKIEEYQKQYEKNLASINKSKESIKKTIMGLKDSKLMFTGKNSDNEIKEIMNEIDSTEIDFAKTLEKRFGNVLANAEERIKQLNTLSKTQKLTPSQEKSKLSAEKKVTDISSIITSSKKIQVQQQSELPGYGGTAGAAAVKTLEDMKSYTSEIVRLQTELGKLNGTNLTFVDTLKDVGAGFSKNMLYIRLFGRGIKDVVSILKTFKTLQDQALSLGVAGGLNIDQINEYRNSILMAARTTKFAAQDIINAQELVVKTGYSLADSEKIVGAASKIALAAFESLEDATELLNKTMLSLDINSTEAEKASQMLYSAIQSTPLNLKSMEVALRQTGSAFGSVIDMTSKSGEALEIYKMQSLETMAALTGALSLLGKSGEMTGTALRTITTAVTSPTKEGTAAINKELASKGVIGANGNALTMQDISRTFSEDMNKGFEMLAKLYTEGQISSNAIRSLVGARNTATITSALTMVSGTGGLEGLKEQITRQGQVSESSSLVLKNWSTELDKTANELKALQSSVLQVADVMSPLLVGFNALLKVVTDITNSSLGKGALIGGGLVFTINSIATAITAISPLMKKFNEATKTANFSKSATNTGTEIIKDATTVGLGVAGSLKIFITKVIEHVQKTILFLFNTIKAHPILAVIFAIATAYTYYTSEAKKNKVALDAINQSISELTKTLETELKKTDISISSLNKTLSTLGNVGLKSRDAVYLLNKELYDVIQNTNSFSNSIELLTDSMVQSRFQENKMSTVKENLKSEDSQIKDKAKAESKYLDFIDFSKINEKDIGKILEGISGKKEYDVQDMAKMLLTNTNKNESTNSGKPEEMHQFEAMINNRDAKAYIANELKNLQSNLAKNRSSVIEAIDLKIANANQELLTLLNQSDTLVSNKDILQDAEGLIYNQDMFFEYIDKIGLKTQNTIEETSKGLTGINKSFSKIKGLNNKTFQYLISNKKIDEVFTNIQGLGQVMDKFRTGYSNQLTDFYLYINEDIKNKIVELEKNGDTIEAERLKAQASSMGIGIANAIDYKKNNKNVFTQSKYSSSDFSEKIPVKEGFSSVTGTDILNQKDFGSKVLNDYIKANTNDKTKIFEEIASQDYATQEKLMSEAKKRNQQELVIAISSNIAYQKMQETLELRQNVIVDSLNYDAEAIQKVTNIINKKKINMKKEEFIVSNMNEYGKLIGSTLNQFNNVEIEIATIMRDKKEKLLQSVDLSTFDLAKQNELSASTKNEDLIKYFGKDKVDSKKLTTDKQYRDSLIRKKYIGEQKSSMTKNIEIEKNKIEGLSTYADYIKYKQEAIDSKDGAFDDVREKTIALYDKLFEELDYTPVAILQYVSGMKEISNAIDITNKKISIVSLDDTKAIMENTISTLESFGKFEKLKSNAQQLDKMFKRYTEAETSKFNKAIESLSGMTDPKTIDNELQKIGFNENEIKDFKQYRDLKLKEGELNKERNQEQLNFLNDFKSQIEEIKKFNQKNLEAAKETFGTDSQEYAKQYENTTGKKLLNQQDIGKVVANAESPLITKRTTFANKLKESGITQETLDKYIENPKIIDGLTESQKINFKQLKDDAEALKKEETNLQNYKDSYDNYIYNLSQIPTSLSTEIEKLDNELKILRQKQGRFMYNAQESKQIEADIALKTFQKKIAENEQVYQQNYGKLEYLKNEKGFDIFTDEKTLAKLEEDKKAAQELPASAKREQELLNIENAMYAKTLEIQNKKIELEKIKYQLQLEEYNATKELLNVYGMKPSIKLIKEIKNQEILVANKETQGIGNTRDTNIKNYTEILANREATTNNLTEEQWTKFDKETLELKKIQSDKLELDNIQLQISAQQELTKIININKNAIELMLEKFDPIFNQMDTFLNTGKFDIKPQKLSVKEAIKSGGSLFNVLSGHADKMYNSMSFEGQVGLMQKTKTGKKDSEFGKLLKNESIKTIEASKTSGQFAEEFAQAGSEAIVGTEVTAALGSLNMAIGIAGVVESFVRQQNIAKQQAALEGLKTEQQILELRKQGSLFEVEKTQIDEDLYKNALEQISFNRKLADAESGFFGDVNDGLTSLFGGKSAKKRRKEQEKREKERLTTQYEMTKYYTARDKELSLLTSIEKNTRDTVTSMAQIFFETQNSSKYDTRNGLNNLVLDYSTKKAKKDLLFNVNTSEGAYDGYYQELGGANVDFRKLTDAQVKDYKDMKWINAGKNNTSNIDDTTRILNALDINKYYTQEEFANAARTSSDLISANTGVTYGVKISELSDISGAYAQWIKYQTAINAVMQKSYDLEQKKYDLMLSGYEYQSSADKKEAFLKDYKDIFFSNKTDQEATMMLDQIELLGKDGVTEQELSSFNTQYGTSYTIEDLTTVNDVIQSEWVSTYDSIIVGATRSGIEAGKTMGESFYDATKNALKSFGGNIWNLLFSEEDMSNINTAMGNATNAMLKVIQDNKKNNKTTNIDDLTNAIGEGDRQTISDYMTKARSASENKFEQQSLTRNLYVELGASLSDAIELSGDVLSQNIIAAIKTGGIAALAGASFKNNQVTQQSQYDEAIANKALGKTFDQNIIDSYEMNVFKESLATSISESFRNGLKTGLLSDYTNSTLNVFGDNLRKKIEQGTSFTAEDIEKMSVTGNIGYAVQELRQNGRKANKQTDAQIKNLRQQGLTIADIGAMGYSDNYNNIASNISSERSINIGNRIAEAERKRMTFLEQEQFYDVNGVTQLRTRQEILDEINAKKARGETLTERELKLDKQIREELNGITDSIEIVNQIRDAFMNIFDSESYSDTFNTFGSNIQKMLKEKVLNNLIDNQFSEQISTLINQATSSITSGDLNGLKAVQNSILAISAQSELTKKQLSGVLSMFDADNIIDYTDKSREINFSSASTKDITYAVTNNIQLNAGTLVGNDNTSMQKLATALVPFIEKAFAQIGKPIT